MIIRYRWQFTDFAEYSIWNYRHYDTDREEQENRKKKTYTCIFAIGYYCSSFHVDDMPA